MHISVLSLVIKFIRNAPIICLITSNFGYVTDVRPVFPTNCTPKISFKAICPIKLMDSNASSRIKQFRTETPGVHNK